MHTRAIGTDGEERAAEHLASLGYKLLQRNYRSRSAEIDIIAEREGCLYFVEVKQQRGAAYGGAATHVDKAKRRKIAHQANRYLAESGWQGMCGFLVVAIDGESIEVIEDFLR